MSTTASSTTKHTPTPWEASDNGTIAITIVAPWSDKVRASETSGYGDYRGLHVAAIEHQNENPCVSKEQASANAAFIVRAVNSHDQLVAALKEALNVIEIIKPPENGSGTLVRGCAALVAAGAA